MTGLYGLRALTDRRILLVFNEHYGKHEDLPFDLRHKGGAIVFKLAPDASKEDIAAEKRKLRGQFARRLGNYVDVVVTEKLPQFEEAPITFNQAAYFERGQTLAQIGDPDSDQIDYPPIGYEGISAQSTELAICRVRHAVALAPLCADSLASIVCCLLDSTWNN